LHDPAIGLRLDCAFYVEEVVGVVGSRLQSTPPLVDEFLMTEKIKVLFPPIGR
jgi:hypothetical protein